MTVFCRRQGEWAAALVLSCTMGLGVAHAATNQVDGMFLSANVGDGWLPADFAQISLREDAPNWTCGSDSCALTEPLSAKLVFAPTSGQPVAVTSQTLAFYVNTITKSQVFVDPLGHEWLMSADAGKWRIGVDIASQSPQAGDAPQFATAYGQFKYTSADMSVLPTWPDGLHTLWDPELGAVAADGTVLGLKTSGEIGLGPGHDGLGVSGGGFSWTWAYRTQLDGANYAYPSSTDVHCASLSCMTFRTGVVNVNDYFLSFDVSAMAAAVPEPGSFALMGLGLAGLSLIARRRSRK